MQYQVKENNVSLRTFCTVGVVSLVANGVFLWTDIPAKYDDKSLMTLKLTYSLSI